MAGRKGIIGALTRLARPTEEIAGTGLKVDNLPAVVPPAEAAEGALSMTRRGLLKRAAATAARSVLPDLSPLVQLAAKSKVETLTPTPNVWADLEAKFAELTGKQRPAAKLLSTWNLPPHWLMVAKDIDPAANTWFQPAQRLLKDNPNYIEDFWAERRKQFNTPRLPENLTPQGRKLLQAYDYALKKHGVDMTPAEARGLAQLARNPGFDIDGYAYALPDQWNMDAVPVDKALQHHAELQSRGYNGFLQDRLAALNLRVPPEKALELMKQISPAFEKRNRAAYKAIMAGFKGSDEVVPRAFRPNTSFADDAEDGSPREPTEDGPREYAGRQLFGEPEGYADGGSVADTAKKGFAAPAGVARGALSALVGIPGDLQQLARILATPTEDAAELAKAAWARYKADPDLRGGLAQYGKYVSKKPDRAATPEEIARLVDTQMALERSLDRVTSRFKEPTYFPDSERVAAALPGAEWSHKGAEFLANILGPLQLGHAARGAKFAGRGALSVLNDAAQGQSRYSLANAALTPMQPLHAMRPRGGNFWEKSLDDYVGELGIENLSSNAQKWFNTQLRNYIKKDLGAPTDPLLAVEAEGRGMHIPLDPTDYLREKAAWGRQGKPSVADQTAWESLKRHAELTKVDPEKWYADADGRLSGEKMITPWGLRADEAVHERPTIEAIASKYDFHGSAAGEAKAAEALAAMRGTGGLEPLSPEDQVKRVLAGDTNVPNWSEWASPEEHAALREKFGWALKDPQAPMYSLDWRSRGGLGFDHVRDYLSAATEPYERVQQLYMGHADPAAYPELLNDLQNGLVNWERGLHPFGPQQIREWARLRDAGLLLQPRELERLSVADAVRKTRDWNAMLAAAQEDIELENATKGIKSVVAEYPDQGLKWVELGPEDNPEGFMPYTADTLPENYTLKQDERGRWRLQSPLKDNYTPGTFETPEEALQLFNADMRSVYGRQRLRDALGYEGDSMGHCVGGHCDDVAEGRSRIYSLRDTKGRPHVTIETQPQNTVENWFSQLPEDRQQVYVDEFEQPGRMHSKYGAWTQEFVDYLKGLQPGAPQDDLWNIVQIKGKGNKKPASAYIPAVQDFLRRQQWGGVDELENAEMYSLVNDGHNYDYAHIAWPFARNLTKQARVDYISKYRAANPDSRLISHGDMEKWLRESGNWDSSFNPSYASGGSVQSAADDPPSDFELMVAAHAKLEN